MRAGRKPKATHLKLLAGNPGHRPLNESEPQPEGVDETPDPPAHLSGEARVEWARTFPILLRNKMISEVDINAFSAYCQAYGRWTRGRELRRKAGRSADLAVRVPDSKPVPGRREQGNGADAQARNRVRHDAFVALARLYRRAEQKSESLSGSDRWGQNEAPSVISSRSPMTSRARRSPMSMARRTANGYGLRLRAT